MHKLQLIFHCNIYISQSFPVVVLAQFYISRTDFKFSNLFIFIFEQEKLISWYQNEYRYLNY